MTSFNVIQLIAIVLAGLLAGLFYGYDCSVINGLGALDDATYLSSFQSINRAILNPYFFMSFMGSLLILPIATCLSYRHAPGSPFYFLLAATVVYAVAVFGVTLFGNVPLNEALDKTDLSAASPEQLSQFRQHFETRWNSLHQVRTYASILAFILSLLSLYKRA